MAVPIRHRLHEIPSPGEFENTRHAAGSDLSPRLPVHIESLVQEASGGPRRPLMTPAIQWLRLHEIPTPEEYTDTRRSGSPDSSPRLPRRGSIPLPARIQSLALDASGSPLRVESRLRSAREATFTDSQGSFTIPVSQNSGIRVHVDRGVVSPSSKSGSSSPKPQRRSSVGSAQPHPIQRAPSSGDSAPHVTIGLEPQPPEAINLFW